MKKKEYRPQKRRRVLSYEKKYEIAYLLFFRNYNVKSICHVYDVSHSYVSRIKQDFIETVEVWKDKDPPEQMEFNLQAFVRRLHTLRRK